MPSCEINILGILKKSNSRHVGALALLKKKKDRDDAEYYIKPIPLTNYLGSHE